MSRGLPEGVFNDAYVICALVFFIKAFIVDSHLNYLDKFIKVYIVCCGYSFELHGRCNSNGFPQHTLL